MKIYKVKIEETIYELYWYEVIQLFKEKYWKIIKKVGRQGGEIKLSIKSIKEELL